MSIELLDPRNAADVEAIASLHEAFLAESPVVKMGKRFLRDFYYSKLVEDGLMGCTLCRADGRVVGFISYTADPLHFMSQGLRRHFFLLSWLMLASVARRPAMVKDLWMVLRMMRLRTVESNKSRARGLGEALSLAVAPEYRSYIPAGGRSRVALRLFDSAVERLQAQGVERVQAFVQPSNVASNFFYSMMGCPFEKITTVGVVVRRYTYTVKRGQKAGA
jgi:ribosomal protein S18 acetylase RimI-like enzyme